MDFLCLLYVNSFLTRKKCIYDRVINTLLITTAYRKSNNNRIYKIAEDMNKTILPLLPIIYKSKIKYFTLFQLRKITLFFCNKINDGKTLTRHLAIYMPAFF